ncbi:hypothetical protein LTR82_001903 [Friedmanniomyces endolithicus]|uniref:Uncharacterized protein n=1 Tax=Friedmanniomyces endolithicus TaxID=329885 RepID=A0AAN6FZ49_9PEZI|nr:hypothetical protein LTR82_001903 [Friedmanniomyces endolithicus]
MAALSNKYMDISGDGTVSAEMFDDPYPDDSDDSDGGASIDGRLGLGGLFSGSGGSQVPGAVPRISKTPFAGPEGSYISVDEPLQHEAHPTGYQKTTPLQNMAYYQDASTFVQPGAPLWRTPQVDPVLASKRSPALRQLVGPEAALVFYTACQLLRKNWSCDPQNALPECFHASTPYSLVLLWQLKVLSSYAKKNMLAAHVILHDHWQKRLASRNIRGDISSGLRSFQTVRPAQDISEYPGKGVYCETEIQENIYGITLQDVRATLRTIKRAVAAADEADDQPAPLNRPPNSYKAGKECREKPPQGLAVPSAQVAYDGSQQDDAGYMHENLVLREREQQNRVAKIELRERVQDLQISARRLTKGEREAHMQPALLRTQLTSAEEASKQMSHSVALGLRLEVDPSQQNAATRARLESLPRSGRLSDVGPRDRCFMLDTSGAQPIQLPIRTLDAGNTILHNSTEVRAEKTTQNMRAIELERLGQRPLPPVPMPWPKKASATGKKWYEL